MVIILAAAFAVSASMEFSGVVAKKEISMQRMSFHILIHLWNSLL